MAMASRRPLTTAKGRLHLQSSPFKSSMVSTCPFCTQNSSPHPKARPRRDLAFRRHQSTSTSLTDPRIELEYILTELHKKVPGFINESRLQLALQGLRQAPGKEAVRVAILGLANGAEGRDTARKVLKALLVDPLVDEQEWEKQLDEHDAARPLIVRVGADPATPKLEVAQEGLPAELYISSADYNSFNLEILLMNLDEPLGSNGRISPGSLERDVLVPGVHGSRTPLITPVHQALLVAEGLPGAVSVLALPIKQSNVGSSILAAVDLKGLSKETLGTDLTLIDTALGKKSVEVFRRGPQHAMEYKHFWSASNIGELAAWLRSGVKSNDGETRPAVRSLIDSILSTLKNSMGNDVDLTEHKTVTVTSPNTRGLDMKLLDWAQTAHTELQEQLDLAFTGGRWGKLGWWKLFWRVDDVAMLTNEMLSQRFLPTAEQELIYLTGQIAQLQGEDRTYSQPTPSRSLTEPPSKKKAQPSLKSPLHTRPALPKWPGHIAFTRHYLQNETVPALQSLAQKLVVQSLATSSLTSILAGLMYISSFSSTIFEAGAVAALGVVYSLGRMQKKWEAARDFWEGEVREEGRKAVRAAEESAAEVLEGRAPNWRSSQQLEDIEKTRELIAKAEDALARMK